MKQEINILQISIKFAVYAIDYLVRQTSEQTLAYMHVEVETKKTIDKLVQNMIDERFEKEQSEGVKVNISESIDDAFFENALNITSGNVFQLFLRDSV